jgi:hypothetical protein
MSGVIRLVLVGVPNEGGGRDMKRAAWLVLALVVIAGLSMVALAKGNATKGKEVEITGQLSCAFCKLSHPEHPCATGCCVSCIKGGDVALITDAKGNMYVVLGNEVKKPAISPDDAELAGSRVVVKGLLVKGKGLQAILVDSMEKVAG